MKNRIFSYILILTLLIVTAGCGSKKQAELNTQNVVETTAADIALTEKQTETESIKETETESENMTEESSEENVDTQEEVDEDSTVEDSDDTYYEEYEEESRNDETPGESRPIIICIDPGHGGDNDEGTKETYDGKLVMEKDLNYRIATSLKSYLEQYDGIKVILTRNENQGLGLIQRIDYAVANEADYFISVHVNSRNIDEVNSHGCMVLMSCSRYQPANTKVGSLYDTERGMALSVISKLNRLGLPIANDWNTENTQGILQRVNTVGATYPDGSQADYYTLLYCGTEAGLPTIIIEHAFLSNENDYRNFLCTNDKLDALAKADAEGIIESIR